MWLSTNRLTHIRGLNNMEGRADSTLAADVQNALNGYLELSESSPDKTHKAKLDNLRSKVTAAKTSGGTHEQDRARQLSLAVQTCSLQPTKVRQLKTLRLEEVKVRNEDTLTSCPAMCIQFQDLSWSDYYPGKSNIKYPDVVGMHPHVCTAGVIQNMMLFDLLQGHRRQICDFQLPDISALTDKLPGLPAIIIPSGGKDGGWLKTVEKDPTNYWWARFVGEAHVIFLVSNDELANYQKLQAKGVTLVGYDGFGMGCARAVGTHVAKKLNRLCFMTDDRTKDLWYNGVPVNAGSLGTMQAEMQPVFPFISGVSPKGELNILTIFNPATSEAEKPVFSRYFIASKEDKGLFLYCEALRLRNPESRVGSLTGDFEVLDDDVPTYPFQFEVKFDGNNPAYENKDVSYTGFKGDCMTAMTKCTLYRSLVTTPTKGVPANGIAFDWTYLKTKKGFLNQWDAIKMQDSAMYLLLKQIYDEMKTLSSDEELEAAHWEAFDRYITPWFS